jgi:hypothetical protein
MALIQLLQQRLPLILHLLRVPLLLLNLQHHIHTRTQHIRHLLIPRVLALPIPEKLIHRRLIPQARPLHHSVDFLV